MMRRGPLSFLLVLLVVASPVFGQVPDPTRPPAAVIDQEGGSGVAAVESGVQTVIVRPGGKSIAVINGQYLAVGDKLGDKRVLKISESEVVLKGEGGREVIKLIPAIEKVPAKKAGAAKPPTTGTTQQ
ncbi:MAG: hypothetical protein M0P95_09270 [Sulfuritalea sp.]|jgi:MSHA biogenesis protein MshK|nr:hypothetical protein [Sulfuritalea sp.]